MSTDAATTVRPRDLADARAAMLDTAGALLFTGGATKLGWGRGPSQVDVVVDTTAMADVVRYDPADATVAVQAGIPVAALQDVLAEHEQWLAIDPPHVADGATVGGVLASNDAGPRRLAHGTMRDLVIGATYVLSDGAVGRTGGHVIKNVAGYDMAKLLCGSRGTLGLVAEVVLRVHPVPHSSGTLRVTAGTDAAARIGMVLGASPVEPVAADWADGAVFIRFAGRDEAVRAQLERTARLLSAERDVTGAVDELDDEASRWLELTEALGGAEGQTVVRAACLPTRLPDAAHASTAAADGAGVAVALHAHVLLGVLTARVWGGDAAAHAAYVHRWRDGLTALGGHAVVRRTAEGVADLVDVWGPPPPAIGLMRRVKQQLDPDGRCAPGSFVGGI